MALQIDIRTLREQLAKRAGIEDPSQLQAKIMQLDTLRNRGVLVAVHCRGVTMFTKKASWGELGIPQSDPRAKLFHRTYREIIPVEIPHALRSLESQARANLRRHGISLPAFAGYYWLPVVLLDSKTQQEDTHTESPYERWKGEHQEILAKLQAVKDRILADLEEWHDVYIPEVFGDVAERAWKELKSAKPSFDESLPTFRNRVIAIAQAQMPTRAEVILGLEFTHDTAFLLNPTDIAQELARRDQIATEARATTDLVRAAASVVTTERHLQETMTWRVHQSMYRRFEEMRQEELDLELQRLQRMDNPFQAIIDHLEGELAQAVQEMTDKIVANMHVHGRVKTRGLQACLRYDAVRSLGQGRLEQAVEHLRQALNTPGDDGQATDPHAVLQALQSLSKQIQAKPQANPDQSSFREAGGQLD